MNFKSIAMTVFFLVCSTAAMAQKTDVVILENGDRITGEINKLEAGLLNFSTDTMGTVNIEWRFIMRIISNKTQSMEMTDGTRLIGQLQKADDSDEVMVFTPRGPVTVDFSQIVSAWPVSATFKDRMDLEVALGYDYQKATAISNLTTAMDFSVANNDRRTEASWRSANTRNKDGSDQSRYDLSASHEYLLAEQRFRVWFARLESNDALGIRWRVGAGGAFGKYLVKNNNNWFSLAGGLLATEEAPFEGESEANLEAMGNLRWRYFRFADPQRSMETNLSLFPNLTDWGRYRASLRTTFKLELIQDLFWSMELWGNYDNRPISADSEIASFDYGITTSIGWSF